MHQSTLMDEIVCKIVETAAEREGHFAVRRAIFVEEQGLFAETDVDEHDDHAILMVAVDTRTGAVVGAVRCIAAGDDVWYGGRPAVLRAPPPHPPAVCAPPFPVAQAPVLPHRRPPFPACIQMRNMPLFI